MKAILVCIAFYITVFLLGVTGILAKFYWSEVLPSADWIDYVFMAVSLSVLAYCSIYLSVNLIIDALGVRKRVSSEVI